MTASDRAHPLSVTGLTPSVSCPLVVGIDPSLTSTGVATSLGTLECIESKPRGTDIMARRYRLWDLCNRITSAAWADGDPDLVVIEGPGMAALNHGGPDLIGLWWLLVDRLIGNRNVAPAIVPPACRMKYATGKGNSKKDVCMAAVCRRYPDFEVTGNDTADALTLCAMGRDYLGAPLVVVPQLHRLGLDGVSWPDPRKGT